MSGRLTGLVAVAASAALAFGAGTAMAGTSTSVSIEAQSIGFFGYVHSSKSSCEGGRKVKLYKVKRSGDVKVGTDIAPGTYKSTGNKDDSCYWERTKDAEHGLDTRRKSIVLARTGSLQRHGEAARGWPQP